MKMFNTQTQPLQPRPSNKSLKTPAATPLAVVLLAVKATHTGRQAAIAINLRAEQFAKCQNKACQHGAVAAGWVASNSRGAVLQCNRCRARGDQVGA